MEKSVGVEIPEQVPDIRSSKKVKSSNKGNRFNGNKLVLKCLRNVIHHFTVDISEARTCVLNNYCLHKDLTLDFNPNLAKKSV